MQQTTRVPVVGADEKPRMPTTPARARKWIKIGKAVPKRNKLGVFYVRLTQDSGNDTQPIIAGVDRGKCFTGVAFQSQLATIAIFHLCLPGFYKSKRTTKDRQSVTGKIAKRHELRRSRRARRIDRSLPFKLRNHRQKRFSNRISSKLSPSIRSNRQMELRVISEMALILPIHQIRDEDCGGNTKRNGRGISPVTVGQEWFRSQAALIAPVVNVDSLTTGNYRERLGLVKERKNKSKQVVETHGNDAIALAASFFLRYEAFVTKNTHGHEWVGDCNVTNALFAVVAKPKLFRRKLHQEQYQKGGALKRQGGTITPFGFRSGDYVKASRKGVVVKGWIGGFTDTVSTKNVSIYDHNWSRIGQFNPANVSIISRSSRLCIAS
jgi:hypothetical protein